MKPLHVLSVIHYPVFGGPHNRNLRLFQPLLDSGIRTTVLLPDEPGNAAPRVRAAGMDIVQCRLGRLRNTRNPIRLARLLLSLPGDIARIRRVIRDSQVDLVQINGLVNPHAAFAAWAEDVPVVWQILDTYAPKVLRRGAVALVNRLADIVMCTGAKVALEHPGLATHPDRLVLFYPPVDVERFNPDPVARRDARIELGIDDAKLVVGTVGNVNLQKGHENFVRAAAGLRRSVDGVRFVILGGVHENHRAYARQLVDLANSIGLTIERDLVVRDPGGRVDRLMQAFDVFWMTSKPNSEGIPTAMEEAMALALPVVSFNVGSIAELLEHGVSGFLIDRQDPDVLARLTEEHLLDPEERATIGAKGQSFVRSRASLEACLKHHLRAYELALGRRHGFRPDDSQRR